MVFTWIFISIVAFFLEIIYDQYSRTLINRYVLVIGYIVMINFTTPTRFYSYNDSLFELLSIISGIILSFKVILIYLVSTELKFNDNVLVPRSEYASIILNEQILRIQNTEYEMAENKEFDNLKKHYRRAYRFYLLPVFLIIFALTLLIFVIADGRDSIFFIAGFTTTSISSLFLLTMLFVWWNNKRMQKIKYVTEEKVEIIPLFAEIID